MLDARLEALLVAFVEATQRAGEEGERTFIVVHTFGSDARGDVVHDELDDFRAHESDIEELAEQGMLRLGRTSQGDLNFYVRPEGFRYYERLKGVAG